MRKEIRTFAEAMERKMTIKDSKYGSSWKETNSQDLMIKFMDEVEEFKLASGFEDNLEELVDIANYAMMLYHKIMEAKVELFEDCTCEGVPVRVGDVLTILPDEKQHHTWCARAKEYERKMREASP